MITVAGLGTRLLPATKEQPKEMLPIFAQGADGQTCLKPLLQLIFEQLYDIGFREFYFVTGRGKRIIEDHFTQDYGYITFLKSKGRLSQALDLEAFYAKLDDSTIVWVSQSEPKGFGDAVLRVQSIVGKEKFLVLAGDTYIISSRGLHVRRLIESQSEIRAEAMLLVKEVDDPRQHGVVELEEMQSGFYRVKLAVEKPKEPISKVAIMPAYVFHPIVFKALEQVAPGIGGEIQLTDAIQTIIDWGHKVCAIKLKPDEVRLDVGTPEAYWEALNVSYEHSVNPQTRAPRQSAFYRKE